MARVPQCIRGFRDIGLSDLPQETTIAVLDVERRLGRTPSAPGGG